jgi:DNA-binding transcriptional MocR family regulator
MIEIRTTGLSAACAAGELLAASGTTDALDALVALVAVPGDQLITSDPADLRTLVAHRAIPVTVVRV